MEPSGLGLVLVGKFLMNGLISSLVTGVLRCSASPVSVLGRLGASRNLAISPQVPNLLTRELFLVISYH